MYTKIVQSGDLLEVYEYEKEPTPKRFSLRKKRRYPRFTRRIRDIETSRKRFKGLVRSSLALGCPALITLTTLDIYNISVGYKALTDWGVRMRREYGKSVQWVAVPEFQVRGAVHFHVLIWGLSNEIIEGERDTRRIQNLWGYGFIDIIATDGSPKLSTYLAKYMQKGMSDSRLVGKKAYSATRGLLRSVSINSPAAIDYFKEEWGIKSDGSLTKQSPLTEIREKRYLTEWLGRATYRAYTNIKLVKL